MTLKDVAKAAGVSHMTVSRVINNDPKVAPETAVHVRSMIKALGYQPPARDKRFRRPSRKKDGIHTENIALVFPDPNARAMRTPISAALAHGAEAILHEHRLNLMVTNFRGPDELPYCLDRRHVDGLLVRRGTFSRAVVNHLREFPWVAIFEGMDDEPPVDHVMPDNAGIGELAARELIAAGCRAGVLLEEADSGLSQPPAFATRRRGFRTAFKAAGLPVRELTEMDLVSLGPHEGLFLLTSVSGTVRRVCRRLADLGRQPGRDAVIAAVDEADYRQYLDWLIINIDPHMEAIGRTAAETLLWRLRNPEAAPRKILIAATVVSDTDMAR